MWISLLTHIIYLSSSIFQVCVTSLGMRSLARRLAVPLFCTFAVSLPYQKNEVYQYDGIAVSETFNNDDFLNVNIFALFAVGEPQTNPHPDGQQNLRCAWKSAKSIYNLSFNRYRLEDKPTTRSP